MPAPPDDPSPPRDPGADDAGGFLPPAAERSLASLRAAIAGCRGCTLHAEATQAVFGWGADDARLVLVGEQPGDREDLTGRPFVGQAGRLLDECLTAAGLDRAHVYLTNAVKHFKFTRRGKRRIHDKPTFYQVRACRPWLIAELEALRPQVLVLAGASAAQAIFGPEFRLTERRGQRLDCPWAGAALATLHPSAVVRIPDPTAKAAARDGLIADLALAASWLA
jgi:DNA polymerase